ncbi:MAG: hypothetical protein LBP38_04570 [Desulfovibrio sp.]|jgi:hypothetical protein|nr:hypothetical protein [Desulfovibrio sp.]
MYTFFYKTIKINKFTAIVFMSSIIFIAGCSTRYSTLNITDDNLVRVAYTGDPNEMLKDIELVMMHVFPGRILTAINGNARGYSTWTRFVLDTYTQIAVIIPTKAKDNENTEYNAYAIDVSGSGTDSFGMAKNSTLFNELKILFDRKYKKVTPI